MCEADLRLLKVLSHIKCSTEKAILLRIYNALMQN